MNSLSVLTQAFHQDALQCLGVLPFAQNLEQVKVIVEFLSCFRLDEDALNPTPERVYLSAAAVSGFNLQVLSYVDNVLEERPEDEQLLLMCIRLYSQWLLDDPDRIQAINALQYKVETLPPGELQDMVAVFTALMLVNELS